MKKTIDSIFQVLSSPQTTARAAMFGWLSYMFLVMYIPVVFIGWGFSVLFLDSRPPYVGCAFCIGLAFVNARSSVRDVYRQIREAFGA